MEHGAVRPTGCADDRQQYVLGPFVSNWTLLPLIRRALGVTNPGQSVMFAGGDSKRLLAVLLILGGFGLMLGILYGLLNKKA